MAIAYKNTDIGKNKIKIVKEKLLDKYNINTYIPRNKTIRSYGS